MARYTNLFSIAMSVSSLRDSLASTLRSCNLTLVYEATDYLVAKEKPGKVSVSQLATVEVLITPPTSRDTQAKVNLVVRNEELPLSMNNHCQRVFDAVNHAIAQAAA